MDTQERKEKINEINESLKNLSNKLKDSTDTVVISGMYAKDELDKKISDAKSNLEATKENVRIGSEKAKGKLSSYILQTQMNMREAKKEFEEKKEARDKAKLETYIDSRLDYAKDSIALAVMAAQEAKVAFLEAIEAQSEYEELYGEKAKKEEK